MLFMTRECFYLNYSLFYGEYLWVPPAPGTYIIQVRAFEEEQVSFPATVHISIIGYEEAATPLPTEDIEDVEGCTFKSVFFPSPERAVKAISRMWEYRRFLEKAKGME